MQMRFERFIKKLSGRQLQNREVIVKNRQDVRQSANNTMKAISKTSKSKRQNKIINPNGYAG